MTVVLFAQPPVGSGNFAPSTPILVAAGGLIVATADGPSALTLTATIQTLTGTIVVASGAVTISEDTTLGAGKSRYTARTVAPLTAGSYQIVWADDGGNPAASEPITVTIGVRPGLSEVAALIIARTKVNGGREIGTFTSATAITDTQAETFIDFALDEVLGKVQPIDSTQPPWAQAGDTYNAPGSPYEQRIRGAVALYAAILAETSLYPEQVRNNQSAAPFLQTLYESRIRALVAEGEMGRPEGEGVGGAGGGDAPGDAFWSFPAAPPGSLVGWGSRF